MAEKCKGKEPYFTHEEAQVACDSLKASARKTGKGGRSFHRLIVYQCGNHFHIGRDCTQRCQKMAEITNSKPVKKIPSIGQLRRRLRNIEDRMLKDARHRAFVWGQIIAADARKEYEAACAAIGIAPKEWENGR